MLAQQACHADLSVIATATAAAANRCSGYIGAALLAEGSDAMSQWRDRAYKAVMKARQPRIHEVRQLIEEGAALHMDALDDDGDPYRGIEVCAYKHTYTLLMYIYVCIGVVACACLCQYVLHTADKSCKHVHT
jgi:hypothetical protein